MKKSLPPQLECTSAVMSRMLGLSVPRISQLVAEGVLQRGERGKLDLVLSVQGYIRKLRDKQKEKIELDGVAPLEESKARREAALAGIAEIRLEAERGKYLPVSEVIESTVRCVSVAKARFLRLQSDLPPRLAGLPETKMQTLIRDSVIEILTELYNDAGKLYPEPLPDESAPRH